MIWQFPPIIVLAPIRMLCERQKIATEFAPTSSPISIRDDAE
jgi:hypothetical protein